MYNTGPNALARDVAVVTGAAGSIGREIAVGLAENGFDVVVACRPGAEARCANVTSSLWSMRRRAAGRRFYIEPIDFSACLSVGAFVQRVSARYGARLVAIVQAAAVVPPKSGERILTGDGMEATFQINVLGVYALMVGFQSALERSVSVVNVASTFAGGMETTDLQLTSRVFNPATAYSQSKAAVQALTWDAAERYNGSGFVYNAVHPGVTHSQMNPGKSVDRARESAARSVQLARSAVSEGLQGTWWEMVAGEHRSERRPRRFDDPTLRRAAWAYCERQWDSHGCPVLGRAARGRHDQLSNVRLSTPVHVHTASLHSSTLSRGAAKQL